MINIVYWFVPGDNHTANDLATSINSIRVHRNIGKDYRVLVCHPGVDSDILRQITDMSLPGFSITARNIKDLPVDNNTIKGACTNKLYAVRSLYPEIERVIVVDLDVLLLCDIDRFYSFNLGDSVFSGFLDYPLFEHNRRPTTYCNAGFFTCDLSKLAKYDINSWIGYINEHPWSEQDAMNEFLSHSNFPTELFTFVGNPNTSLGKTAHEILGKVSVVHYAGPNKGLDTHINEEFRKLWISYMPARIPPRILIHGPRVTALGDNILFADIVGFVNSVFPYLDVDIVCLDSTAEVLNTCGCVFSRVSSGRSCGYWRRISTLSYFQNGIIRKKHLLAQLMSDFCSKAHIDPKLVKRMYLVHSKVDSSINIPKDYVLVPSLEPEKYSSRDKTWTHWNDMVALLKKSGYTVYELNTWINHDKTYLFSDGIIYTGSLADSAKLLKNAKFTVTTENGLNHWACHNGGRTYCIIKSQRSKEGMERARKEEISYRTMIPVECYEDDSAEHVMSVIKEHEK